MVLTGFISVESGQAAETKKLWRKFFADPSEWLDVRAQKVRSLVLVRALSFQWTQLFFFGGNHNVEGRRYYNRYGPDPSPIRTPVTNNYSSIQHLVVLQLGSGVFMTWLHVYGHLSLNRNGTFYFRL